MNAPKITQRRQKPLCQAERRTSLAKRVRDPRSRFTATHTEFDRNPVNVAHTLFLYAEHFLGELTKKDLIDSLRAQDKTICSSDVLYYDDEYLARKDGESCLSIYSTENNKFFARHGVKIFWIDDGARCLLGNIGKFSCTHCPEVGMDYPWEGLQSLQTKAAYMPSTGNAREAQFQAEIDRLKEEREEYIKEKEALMKEKDKYIQENKDYRTTITHLAYRHLMEALPTPVPGQKHGQAWKAFWANAVTQADKRNKLGPVKDLLDSLPKSIWASQIEADGKSLYSTYSVNIHGFAGLKGIYEVDPTSISNLSERLIIQALRPNDANVTPDGEIDWAAERRRFI